VSSLFPFLYTSFITAYLNLSGNRAEKRDLLEIKVKREMIKGALSFKNLMGISSTP
jgi:hypothetical protein